MPLTYTRPARMYFYMLALPTYPRLCQLSFITPQPSPAFTTRPVEPSRSLSTRSLALINSAIALFNCTADFSGTTQDDSRRLRQSSRASLPGPLFAVINRAGLAVLADRLSQSRSQHSGRSPLLTRILLSIPARPDCCCTQQSSIQRHALSASLC